MITGIIFNPTCGHSLSRHELFVCHLPRHELLMVCHLAWDKEQVLRGEPHQLTLHELGALAASVHQGAADEPAGGAVFASAVRKGDAHDELDAVGGGHRLALHELGPFDGVSNLALDEPHVFALEITGIPMNFKFVQTENIGLLPVR